MEQKDICTVCKFCGKQCHMLADTDENGRVERIHPDTAYKTIWCETGKNALNLMNHPERIRMPLEEKTAGRRLAGRKHLRKPEKGLKNALRNMERIHF